MGKTKIKKIEEVSPEEKELITDSHPELARLAAPCVAAGARQVSGSSSNEMPKQARHDNKKEKTSKKKQKQSQPKKRSKKYQQALEAVDKNQKLPALEAVKKTQAGSYSKFEGTIEAHINTNAKNLRGLINLPFARGKKLRILAFPSIGSGQVAVNLGNDVIIGNDETIAEIEKGPSIGSGLDFDIVATTPEWMPKLAKVAKILGPRGLMPNPKNGTISENLEKTVLELHGGKTEYKTEDLGQVIHLSVGKVSQKPEEIVANLKVIYNTVGRSKIQKISLSPTMGPSVKVDLSSI